VAIKFLTPGSGPTAELRRRFELEAIAASRMRHPNCVPVIDFGTADDTPFLVMDFVAGHTLREVLGGVALPIPRALALARQVLAGLAHAHAHGIIHRDVKPENILVWSDELGEHLQLADFGLAKVDAVAISQQLAIGTPSYMSPEQTLGLPVDARADVYAAGVLLFELITGEKPFRGLDPFHTMSLHRDAPVPTFEATAPHRLVTPGLEHVVRRALAKLPADRFSSAVELAHALERAMTTAYDDAEDLDVSALLAEARRFPRWVTLLVLLVLVSSAIVFRILS
jgi:serine/threonine-protein kinase